MRLPRWQFVVALVVTLLIAGCLRAAAWGRDQAGSMPGHVAVHATHPDPRVRYSTWRVSHLWLVNPNLKEHPHVALPDGTLILIPVEVPADSSRRQEL
jgi:hypothetical protein